MSGWSTIKGRSQNITRGFAKTSSMNQTTLLQALATQRVQSNCDGGSSPNASEKGQGVCQAVLQRQRETQALSLHTPRAPVIRQQTVLCCALSRAPRFATPCSVACQGPLSTAFSRQAYRSGLPSPPPGDLPDPGIKPASLASPALAGGFFTTSATWEVNRLCEGIQFVCSLNRYLLSQ